MQWSRVSGATSYNLGLRDLDTYELVVDRDGYTGTSYSVSSLTEGHRYRWNVQACNDFGCSAYSSLYYFQVGNPRSAPEVPQIFDIGNSKFPGPELSDRVQTLRWSNVVGAIAYNFGLRDLDTGQLIVGVDGYASTSYTTPALTEGHSYRWNVQACNNFGCSAYSAQFYFHIGSTASAISVPAVPDLITPGATSVPIPVLSDITPTLQWSVVRGATYYNLGVSDTETGMLVVDIDELSGTSFTTSSLSRGHRYRWDVAACNSKGCSRYSEEMYFQIASIGAQNENIDYVDEDVVPSTAQCAIIMSNAPEFRINLPHILFNGELWWGRIAYASDENAFKFEKGGVQVSEPANSACILPLSQSGYLHLPKLWFLNALWWLDLQLTDSINGIFSVTGFDVSNTEKPIESGFVFPLDGFTPYTAEITAILDHTDPGKGLDGSVEAYTGEIVRISDPGVLCRDWDPGNIFNTCSSSDYSNHDVVGYGKVGANFVQKLENYNSGVAGQARNILFYDGHTGYDYAVPDFTDVVAAEGGIAYKYSDGVKIEHSSGYATFYLHLSTIHISDGQNVLKGVTTIGTTGSGHLHFTVHNRHGARVDPYGWEGASGQDPLQPGNNNIPCLWQVCN